MAIQNMVLLGTLAVSAYRDCREKQVYVYSMLITGIAGLLLHLLYHERMLADLLAGAGIGAAVILFAYMTKECIGTGDGAVLTVTGIFLGFWANLQLFMTALFLAGITALILLITKKKGRRYRLPFVPFLLAAYLVQLI